MKASHLSRLRLDGSAIRYVIATFASIAVSLGLPMLLVEVLAVNAEIAVAVGLVCTAVLNFLTLKYYVYRNIGAWARQAIRFIMTSALFRVTEYLVFLLLHTFLGLNYMLALGTVLGASFLSKFFVYRVLVFDHHPNRGL